MPTTDKIHHIIDRINAEGEYIPYTIILDGGITGLAFIPRVYGAVEPGKHLIYSDIYLKVSENAIEVVRCRIPHSDLWAKLLSIRN